jgi:tripartite-type tricarboxylate transporter receptor subunit TctC
MQRVLLACALVVVSGISAAQYPSKPIRFIVGFPPGGSADPTTRILGQALSDQMGQPVIVDNRPGADSALAAEQMTRIAPDGYTIMFASNSAMTGPVALRKVAPYDPLKDFTPISLVGRATVILYAHPSVPAKTLKEFIEYARAIPASSPMAPATRSRSSTTCSS